MSGRRIAVVITLGIALLAGAVAYRFTPLWPGPALPAGATRLVLVTAAPHLIPVLACPTALLDDVRVATAGDELIVVSASEGTRIDVTWPAGWAAWRLDGRAELFTRDGVLVGREGDVIGGFGGGFGLDDRFHVCTSPV